MLILGCPISSEPVRFTNDGSRLRRGPGIRARSALWIRMFQEMEAAGVRIISEPRLTGDGYYEAVVADPDGNLVEITS